MKYQLLTAQLATLVSMQLVQAEAEAVNSLLTEQALSHPHLANPHPFLPLSVNGLAAAHVAAGALHHDPLHPHHLPAPLHPPTLQSQVNINAVLPSSCTLTL